MHMTSVATAVQLHLAQENQHQFTISLVISRSRGWCHVNWGIDCDISAQAICVSAPRCPASLCSSLQRLRVLEDPPANCEASGTLGTGRPQWEAADLCVSRVRDALTLFDLHHHPPHG